MPKKKKKTFRFSKGIEKRLAQPLSDPTKECRHGPWDDRCDHCWTPPGGWVEAPKSE